VVTKQLDHSIAIFKNTNTDQLSQIDIYSSFKDVDLHGEINPDPSIEYLTALLQATKEKGQNYCFIYTSWSKLKMENMALYMKMNELCFDLCIVCTYEYA
jgi:hypothetical protein